MMNFQMVELLIGKYGSLKLYSNKSNIFKIFASEPIKDVTAQRVHLSTSAKTYNLGDIASNCYIDIPVHLARQYTGILH